jgi:hypothetical protein
MPKLAVSHEMAKRSLDPASCRPEEIYALSTLFGVSYGGFVTHLEKALNLIDMGRASELVKHQPKHIRESILGDACPQNLIVVDNRWEDRAVDLEVGDTIVLPPNVEIEGFNATIVESSPMRSVVTAMAPGICRVNGPDDWSVFVRVSRKQYVGRAPYRFDAEYEDDDV